MNVFTRSLTDDLASLVKQIDTAISENEDASMQGFVVLLTDDPDAAEEDLKAFAEKHGIENVPLTVFEGIAGPPNYKVAEEADVTVHLWKGRKVKANFAYGEEGLNEEAVQKIIADTSKILE